MQVNDAARIVVEQQLGNDLPEVCKQRRLRTEGRDSFHLRCITHLGGMFDPQSGTARPGVDRGRREGTASAGGAWRRRHNSNDTEAGVRCNGAERRDRESATPK